MRFAKPRRRYAKRIRHAVKPFAQGRFVAHARPLGQLVAERRPGAGRTRAVKPVALRKPRRQGIDPPGTTSADTTLAAMVIEKGARAVLMPMSDRCQLFDLSDDMATKVDMRFFEDARDAPPKVLVE